MNPVDEWNQAEKCLFAMLKYYYAIYLASKHDQTPSKSNSQTHKFQRRSNYTFIANAHNTFRYAQVTFIDRNIQSLYLQF